MSALRGIAILAFSLSLAACSFGWGGHRSDKTESGTELSSLRAERDDLRARLRSAQMREDTRSFRNEAFPANGAMSTWQMEGRLSELEHRIRTLEEAERAGNTSTAEDSR